MISIFFPDKTHSMLYTRINMLPVTDQFAVKYAIFQNSNRRPANIAKYKIVRFGSKNSKK